jgi:hypothetical protein
MMGRQDRDQRQLFYEFSVDEKIPSDHLNFDPFCRSSVGFDRILELMDESLRYQPENNYPPTTLFRAQSVG